MNVDDALEMLAGEPMHAGIPAWKRPVSTRAIGQLQAAVSPLRLSMTRPSLLRFERDGQGLILNPDAPTARRLLVVTRRPRGVNP